MSEDREELIDAAARQVLRYRLEGVQTMPSQAVRAGDYETARAVQDRVAVLAGLPVAGWKVGGTDDDSRSRLKIPHPFSGRIFGPRLLTSPARLDFLTVARCIVECEIGVRLGRDLPPGRHAMETVQAAIASYHPAFEIVDFTISDRQCLTGIDFFADNGCCGGMVVGNFARPLPEQGLADIELTMNIDGKAVSSGPVGRPWSAIVESVRCLADHLGDRGVGLQAGQFILTGTLTGLNELSAGSTVVADFRGLGAVSAHFPAGA